MSSALIPCIACGRPRKRTARGGMCRECWRLSRQHAKQFCRDCGAELATSGKAYISTRCLKCHRAYMSAHPELRRLPKRQCSQCGKDTRRAGGICSACESGERYSGSGRIRFVPEKPETCPSCAGLPWRRGNERPGSVCRKCGLPYEAEPQPTIDEFMGRRDAA